MSDLMLDGGHKGGKSTHILYSSRRTETCVLIQILYLSKSENIQALKCTQSIKIKSPLRDISTTVSVQSQLNLTSYIYII